MADIVTFDGVNLRIVEIDASGDNELTIEEIYSEWKVWVKIGDNAKFPQAFRYVGADETSETEELGSTFFLMNWWRMRPAESDHKLTIVGNLVTEPAGFSAFVTTIGDYMVNTETRFTNLFNALQAFRDEVRVEIAYDGTDVKMGVWMLRRDTEVLNPIQATVNWYNPDGSLLFTENNNTPDANGHFVLTKTQALTGNTAYYLIATVQDPKGTVVTHLGMPTVGT